MPALFVCGFAEVGFLVPAEAVISYKQEQCYEDQPHKPVVGNEHDQHSDGYEEGNESDYFFHFLLPARSACISNESMKLSFPSILIFPTRPGVHPFGRLEICMLCGHIRITL